MRAEAEARAREEHDRKLREEVKRLTDKKLARVAKRDRQLEEKLMVVLEGQMSQAELEIDLEVEKMGGGRGKRSRWDRGGWDNWWDPVVSDGGRRGGGG